MDLLSPVGFRVKNFKSIKDSEVIEAGDLNIFIGKNDAGKSSFLEALKIFLKAGKPNDDHFHKWSSDEMIIKAFFEQIPDELKESLGEDYKPKREEDLVVERKFKKRSSTTPKAETFLNGEKLSSGAIIRNGETLNKSKSRQFIWRFLPKPISILAERDVGEETKLKSGTFLSKLVLPILEGDVNYTNESLEEMKSQLEERLNKNAEELGEQLSEKIKSHMPNLERVDIDSGSVNLGKAIKPSISLKDEYLDKSVDISERGSGVGSLLILSLMQTYADRDIGAGYCLLFEEPGNCLHPGAERQMLTALKEISKEGGQIFLTTHSQVFVDDKSSANMYLVKRKNGESNFNKIPENSFQAIEEIGARNSDILQSDFIVYVEGPSDCQVVEVIAKNAIEGWEEKNAVVQHLGGTANLQHCKLKELRKINKNFCFILDSDRHSTEEDPNQIALDLKERSEEAGVECKILSKRELENYFTNEAINKVFDLSVDPGFVSDFEDMPKKISEKLNEENCNENKYRKNKHGKEIVQEMYANGDSVREIEVFIREQME